MSFAVVPTKELEALTAPTDGVTPNFGGFMTFPEFINNMPSELDSSFTLEVKEGTLDLSDPTYILKYNRNGRSRSFGENLFSFSDGEKMYIRVTSSSLFTENYKELNVREFFSFYTESHEVSSMVAGGANGSVNTVTYILDMSNGRSTPLTRPSLRQLLRQKDSELYQYLLANEDDNATLLQYIERLNQRLAEK